MTVNCKSISFSLYIKYSLGLVETLIKDLFTPERKITYEFNSKLKQNFRKIISNIFYLNAKRVCNEYEILRKKEDEINKINESKIKYVQDLYMKNLEITREKVCIFYKIEDDSMITMKTQLRSYIFLLDVNSEDYKWYKSADSILLKIEENLTLNLIPEEYLADKDTFEVKDEVIDLERLTKNIVDMNSVEI